MATDGAAMRSVIAQLGERQQIASRIGAGDRPSPGVKPQPTGKKPTGAAVSQSLGREPRKSLTSSAGDAASKPPITALKPSGRATTGTPQPGAALTGVAAIPGPAMLRPTAAAKSPATARASTTSPPESADDAGPVPPWQNLVKKKNGPPTPGKRQTPAGAVTVKTSNDAAEVQPRTVSPSTDSDDVRPQSATEDPEIAAVSNVRSRKQAFEGASRSVADALEPSRRGSGNRGGTLKAAVDTSTTAPTREVCSDDDRLSQSGAESRTPTPRSRDAGLGKPGPQQSNNVSPRPSRQPVSSGPTTDRREVVVGEDGRRYRRLPPPGQPTTGPVRKPAKPPSVDLSPYRSLAAPATVSPAAGDKLYDDAAPVLPTNGGGVTLRGGGATGRQNAESVVSQIAEYTEEEEMEGRVRRSRGPATGDGTGDGTLPVSVSSDEYYDDVVPTETPNTAYSYDDEVYEVLD